MHLFQKLLLTSCIFSLTTWGQITQYKSLLDIATKSSTHSFVSTKPISKIGLDEKELQTYFENFEDLDKKRTLDTLMILQIIKNCSSIDTTLWTDAELDKCVLVKNRTQNVQMDDVIKKFKLVDKKQIKTYKKIIDQQNSTDNFNKNIYSYSRPVFDNAKQFAIVQWDNGHGGLGGGGGIKLYHLIGDKWTELGVLTRWVY